MNWNSPGMDKKKRGAVKLPRGIHAEPNNSMTSNRSEENGSAWKTDKHSSVDEIRSGKRAEDPGLMLKIKFPCILEL